MAITASDASLNVVKGFDPDSTVTAVYCVVPSLSLMRVVRQGSEEVNSSFSQYDGS